jgi:hypothetical protein
MPVSDSLAPSEALVVVVVFRAVWRFGDDNGVNASNTLDALTEDPPHFAAALWAKAWVNLW